ncbi:MAG: NUDIX hydrolase, partial [Gemmataceae bacterium]
MWIFLPCGFYSVVNKPGDSHLTVRARLAADLDALRGRHLPSLSATAATPGADDPFRATASHEAFAEALARAAAGVTYPDFKSEV